MKILSLGDHPDLQQTVIGNDTRFRFHCHPEVPCFGQCCHNLRLLLYPYDVLRLKQRLKMDSEAFLDRHTISQVYPNDPFPEVLLRMKEEMGDPCPFLSAEGCSVYEDRPDTCRMFPLDRGLEFDDQGRSRLRYFFRPPAFCRGVDTDRSWNIDEWILDQKADLHAEMTEKWAAVRMLFHQWGDAGVVGRGAREKEIVRMAFLAAYNIDAFRSFVFESTFLKRFHIPSSLLRRCKTDDVSLLRIGMAWIRWLLTGVGSPDLRYNR